jgi:hypothetical protein
MATLCDYKSLECCELPPAFHAARVHLAATQIQLEIKEHFFCFTEQQITFNARRWATCPPPLIATTLNLQRKAALCILLVLILMQLACSTASSRLHVPLICSDLQGTLSHALTLSFTQTAMSSNHHWCGCFPYCCCRHSSALPEYRWLISGRGCSVARPHLLLAGPSSCLRADCPAADNCAAAVKDLGIRTFLAAPAIRPSAAHLLHRCTLGGRALPAPTAAVLLVSIDSHV